MRYRFLTATLASATALFFVAQDATAQSNSSSKGIFGFKSPLSSVEERANSNGQAVSQNDTRKTKKKRKKVSKPREIRGSFY
ncbi:MAG: hypothetical protein AAGF53_10930 [Pseudomonadota bacterium]